MSIMIIISLLLSGYALYRVVTAEPGEKITLAPGVTIQKEARGIASITRDPETKDIIVNYTDGTTQNLGHVSPIQGEPGEDAIISPEIIATAVSVYCDNGRCEGRSVTPADVAFAVQDYCSDNSCRGVDGRDGKDAVVTSDMVASAVATYCSGGLCKGEKGDAGAPGTNASPNDMACVIRTVNGIDTRFVAWKLRSESNTAYRDVYKLPVWAECTDPVDLRSV